MTMPAESDAPVALLPFPFANRHQVILTEEDGQPVLLSHGRPSPEILSEVRRFAGRALEYRLMDQEAFSELMTQCYHQNSADALQHVAGIGDDPDLSSLADAVPETEDLLEQSDDAPVIRLINALLTEAIKEGASDIHIETFESRLVARFRVDGVLREILSLKRALAALLVSRIKVMGRMDIAEKRIPQDGRISLRVAGKEVDVRVSTLPSSNGERVVLRLLDKAAGRLHLEHLGMPTTNMERIRNMLSQPHGIILVTGPTGSGKTTTLYAGLSSLNDASRNILTVEDPIEYNLEGIGQTQVNTKVDMTFARGLRAILRQDPDVVMVGEIRDTETAEIAVQASLTGHLVLSTLHTNTAVGAITRLQDMGVEPFLLSSSLVGVMAQRLVRLLCDNCKEGYTADEVECRQLGVDPSNPPTLYHARGCSECKNNGYRGRTGIYEVIQIDELVRRMIHRNDGEQDIVAYVRETTPGIRDDGMRKVLDGATTLEEVLRVTQDD
ncbi:type II secretion system ATPase GspE [Sansalvadorimonas sp. 2012CJ34-2]|uniref:Type II secretion system protein E n=1 Tax=Parendozoicomonas callyspongiae TaxID=2942213 RepID=A0ABT0PIT4_9GAMM|nr:type II secretion system ATPase GspE [Sansalvadorimonas sp. 2012CJ34-2]MCL6271141.1 type II secretion system ATPase GspE [Sansalvadorimonas sp. 2012CJ34-2]